MNIFNGAERVGIRDIETDKLLAVYPYKPSGTQTEIEKAVKDWFYKQSCSAEEEMGKSYVGLLTEKELESYK